MNDEVSEKILLHEELNTSIKLIKLGFGEYQNLDLANDFYYLPFQLISSGFERLMKCHICLGHYEKNNSFPEPNLFRNKLKHDLLKLKSHILENYFQGNSQALLQDFEYLKDDKDLEHLLSLLSEFGKFARYYNLNVVTGEVAPGIDVKQKWEEYENRFIKEDKELLKKLSKIEGTEEVIRIITQKTIGKLERFVRALSRQFTLGKLGSLAQQFSPSTYEFLTIKDSDFETIDYRQGTTRYKKREYKTHKRTIKDKINRKTNSNYRSKKISKDEYEGEWPFLSDSIIIECRNQHWCIVTIDGYDYALNGAAKDKYKIENTHEAGMAILGKSTQPFIDLALKLGEVK